MLLEHDADRAQGFARCMFDVMTGKCGSGRAGPRRRITGTYQREQRALAGAVEAQQHSKTCVYRERHTAVARAIAVAHAVDGDGGAARRASCHASCGPPVQPAVAEGRKVYDRREIAIPQGNSPTWIDLMTRRLATSMTETSFDTPLVVRRYFSSGVNAMCQTADPRAETSAPHATYR